MQNDVLKKMCLCSNIRKSRIPFFFSLNRHCNRSRIAIFKCTTRRSFIYSFFFLKSFENKNGKPYLSGEFKMNYLFKQINLMEVLDKLVFIYRYRRNNVYFFTLPFPLNAVDEYFSIRLLGLSESVIFVQHSIKI